MIQKVVTLKCVWKGCFISPARARGLRNALKYLIFATTIHDSDSLALCVLDPILDSDMPPREDPASSIGTIHGIHSECG